MKKFKKTKKRDLSLEIDKFVACLPGYVSFNYEPVMKTKKIVYLRSTNELKLGMK